MRHAESVYGNIHWKTSGFLASKSPEEQCFSELSVKVTKEVVSLDLTAEEEVAVRATPTGVHLSPEAFHAQLQSVQEGTESNVVLVDVRNLYETRIGRFDVPESAVDVIDPQTRKVPTIYH
jgi:predicted sulfurtransferase